MEANAPIVAAAAACAVGLVGGFLLAARAPMPSACDEPLDTYDQAMRARREKKKKKKRASASRRRQSLAEQDHDIASDGGDEQAALTVTVRHACPSAVLVPPADHATRAAEELAAQAESQLWLRAEERAAAKVLALEQQNGALLSLEVAEAVQRQQRLDRAACKDEWLCPISKSVMTDPVVAADGHTYEKNCIERWLRRRMTSPMTNEPLPDSELRPNHAMRSQIHSWVAASGALHSLGPARMQAAQSPLPRPARMQAAGSPLPHSPILDHSLRLPVAIESALAAGSAPAGSSSSGPLANSRVFEVENRAHADIIAEGVAVSSAALIAEADVPAPAPAGAHVASAAAPSMPPLLQMNFAKLIEALDMLQPHARLPVRTQTSPRDNLIPGDASDTLLVVTVPSPADYVR